MATRKNEQPADEAGAAAPTETVVISIKGFDQSLSCRGHAFEVGKSYEVTGKIGACTNGFHAVPDDEHPFAVFGYYPPTSRFALVTQSGAMDKEGDKLASAKITISAEISLGDLTKRAIDWVLARIDKSKKQTNTGYQSAATNTGNRSAATNTGDQSAATNTGYQSAAANTGYQSAAANTGYQSAATNTGDQSAATNTGNRSAATNTGDQSAATNTGYQSAAEVSGERSAALASGYAGRVRGKPGNALFAVERDDSYAIVSVACGIAGKDGVPADVWLFCKGGKLVKVED